MTPHRRGRRGGAGNGRVRARSLVAAGFCLLLVVCLCGAASPSGRVGRAWFPLDSATLAIGAHNEIVRVDDPDELVPGTRVLADTVDSRREVAEQRQWLSRGSVPPLPGRRSTLVTDALLDLHVLGGPTGVPVAGWAPAWRYVWPRDSALVATALARTGHVADAQRVLGFLQRVQPASGIFAARYRPDGSVVADGRAPQHDSVGWALWALEEVTAEVPATGRTEFLAGSRPLLERSSAACLALVANRRSLPVASPDYWETRQPQLTLSTAAMVDAGLLAAARLYATQGDQYRSAVLAEAAEDTTAAITRTFRADGYPRTIGGPASSVDLGVSFLLPPFARSVDPEVLEAWRGSAAVMSRPAGGLAPGGSWRLDGVSWNTATSSRAMTAAFVSDRGEALRRLRWLDEHRTAAGSLPEKVLDDDEPASVAPLAWAAAAVVIAVDELARDGG